jgi:hypothetical protein
MSIKDWNAGIIRPVAVAPTGPFDDGVASGVWTMDEAAYWTKQGLWPTAGNVAPIGLFGGNGSGFGQTNQIERIVIATTGNSTDFGDLTAVRYQLGACSSSTRAVFAGGIDSVLSSVIDYVTFATAGNAANFGNLLASKSEIDGCSSSTRGVFAGGQVGTGGTNTPINVIEYVTIATTGNGTDFGDIAVITRSVSACSSSTRGVFANGQQQSYSEYTNTISYVTIATTGNATDFGDTTALYGGGASCSNSTRGLIGAGGGNGGVFINTIEYITIASTGNATDFGDLLNVVASYAACSSPTRGVFGGGSIYDYGSGGTTYYNVIQFVTIASTGNATDFGDLTTTFAQGSACSSAHGGL